MRFQLIHIFFVLSIFPSFAEGQSTVSRTLRIEYPQEQSSIELYPSNFPISLEINPVGEAGSSSLPINTVLAQTQNLVLNYDVRSDVGSSPTINARLSPGFPIDILQASLVLISNSPSTSGQTPTVPNTLILNNTNQVWISDVGGLYSGIGATSGVQFRIEIENNPNGDYSNAAAGDYNATVEFNILP